MVSMLKIDFKRSILNTWFAISILAIALLHFIPIWYEMSVGAKADVYYFLYLSLNATETKLLMLPLCILPYGMSFCTDWDSHFFQYTIARKGVKQYAASRMICVAATSFLVVFISLSLVVIVLSITFPLYNKGTIDGIPFMRLLDQNALLYYLSWFYCISFGAAFWADFSVFISAFMPNKFVVFFTPLVGFYLLNYVYLYSNMIPLLNLNILANAGLDFGSTIVSLLYVALVHLLFMTLMLYGFQKKVQSRLING